MNGKRLKIGMDLFYIQMIWTSWFLGITFTIHLVQLIISIYNGSKMSSYFASLYFSGNIYMFIIAIIATCIVLPLYVQNGVTRKDFFYGSLLSTLALAILIPLIGLLVSLIEMFIVNVANLPSDVFDMTGFGSDDNDFANVPLIARVFLTFFVPPFMAGKGLLLHFLLSILNLCFYYLNGWMIGAAFYRLGALFGIGTIIFSIIIYLINGSLWGHGTLPDWLPVESNGLNGSVAVLGTIIFGMIVLIIIRKLTARVPIKVG